MLWRLASQEAALRVPATCVHGAVGIVKDDKLDGSACGVAVAYDVALAAAAQILHEELSDRSDGSIRTHRAELCTRLLGFSADTACQSDECAKDSELEDENYRCGTD